ncbi:NADH dehydrogenase [ubiquinone] iron-sulfur protein 2 [Capsicum chinense]|nr:NADH dehydrogenase [ubiquinone] iron-sulfur protein 2 [Capsicum chinense]
MQVNVYKKAVVKFRSSFCRQPYLYFYDGPRIRSFFSRKENFELQGVVAQDLPLGLCIDIDSFTQQFAFRIDELEEMSTGNRVWKQRLLDIGTVTTQKAKDWGFSGVMLRGSGVCWDLQKVAPYDVHDQLDPDIPVGLREVDGSAPLGDRKLYAELEAEGLVIG